MDNWADETVTEIMKCASGDTFYQTILEQCRTAEIHYTRIVEKLTECEQTQVDSYIALCEELQYQFARLAYYYGVHKGAAGRNTSE